MIEKARILVRESDTKSTHSRNEITGHGDQPPNYNLQNC